MFLFYNLNNGNEFSDGDIDLEAKLQNLSFLIIFLSFFMYLTYIKCDYFTLICSTTNKIKIVTFALIDSNLDL